MVARSQPVLAILLTLFTVFAPRTPARGRILEVPPPDSSVDAAEILQKAVDRLASEGGGTIRLGAGVFWIGGHDKAVKVYNSAPISFEGTDGTVIRQRPGTNANNFFHVVSSDSIRFSGIRFVGTPIASMYGDDAWQTAIQFEGEYSDFEAERCRFSDFRTGAVRLLGRSVAAIIRNCVFVNASNKFKKTSGDYGAVELEWAFGVKVIGNRFFDLKHSAVSIIRGERVTLSGNSAWFDPASTRTMGVYVLEGIRNSTFSGNDLHGVSNEGFDIQSKPGGLPIEGNVISGNRIEAGFIGVGLNQSACGAGWGLVKGNVISRNFISGMETGLRIDSVDHGVYVSNAESTRVTDNEISYFRTGIHFQCSAKNIVMANRLRRGSICGITLNGAGSVRENEIDRVPMGIHLSHSDGAEAIGNKMLGIAIRLSKDTTAMRASVRGNCDDKGGCD